ncbi:3-phenylpropionate MFS transporter [Alginatibacterium sediminis]|uniref:3-phenylpropionate MFS transporter n=1 Tax=Alginatibacterium sediminis TaxID=2164068 RepID=A0A420EAQ5_9ALTE|nr:3-phenylpropionate MFS transporter [Alginatibacterium sediminis]RKF17779.1 3-phenylpropionate MFS transporter [Alginatibacterium sediminis]
MQLKAPVWLASFFTMFFAVWACFIPFWSLWLSKEGMNASDIGMLLSFGMLARFIGGIVIVPRVKQNSQLIPVSRWLLLISIVAVALMYFKRDLWVLVAVTLLINALLACLIPLGDSMATRWIHKIKLNYGQVRVWGSASFMVMTMVMGVLISNWGEDTIIIAVIITSMLTLFITYIPASPALDDDPDSDQSNQTETKSTSFWQLLQRPSIVKFIVVVALIQGSHAAYYAYSALYWKSIGFSESIIGYLWGAAVIFEMGMMVYGQKLFSRWNPERMLILAAIGCSVRWFITGMSDDLWLIAIAQSLHAVSYAVAHLASIKYIAIATKGSETIALQGLYSALALNLGTALLTFICGYFYTDLGNSVFVIMAVVSAASLLLLLIKPKPVQPPAAQA